MADQELSIMGEVDHSGFYKFTERDYYFNLPAIRRSYFVGDYIYAISQNGITATRLSDMITTDAYTLKTPR